MENQVKSIQYMCAPCMYQNNTLIGRWQVSNSLLNQLTQCLTHTPSLLKRLTLMRRQTQLSTHDMRTMTPHNPPLTNVTIDVTTDPQTNGATVTNSRNVRSRGIWSKRSAIHNKSQSLLCSSSIHEPSDPPLKVYILHTSYFVARHATLSSPTHW